jgi:hypothetical protein
MNVTLGELQTGRPRVGTRVSIVVSVTTGHGWLMLPLLIGGLCLTVGIVGFADCHGCLGRRDRHLGCWNGGGASLRLTARFGFLGRSSRVSRLRLRFWLRFQLLSLGPRCLCFLRLWMGALRSGTRVSILGLGGLGFLLLGRHLGEGWMLCVDAKRSVWMDGEARCASPRGRDWGLLD